MDWGWVILPLATIGLGWVVLRAFRDDPVRRRMRKARDQQIRDRIGGLPEAKRQDP